MKFHYFGPCPGKIFWATSGKIHYYPSLEKNPSEAHGQRHAQVGLIRDFF